MLVDFLGLLPILLFIALVISVIGVWIEDAKFYSDIDKNKAE